MSVGLIDYGAGSVISVRNALEHIGAPSIILQRPVDFDQVTHLVLPGVGSFPTAMERLRTLGLDEAIRAAVVGDGKPLPGIASACKSSPTKATNLNPARDPA